MEKTFENWLVVSDIDGTLNNKLRKLPKRNYNAIKEFTDRGGNFTLASGRLQSSLERNYNRITANQPAIVLNGAGLYDYRKQEMMWRSTIGEKGREFVKYISEEFDEIFKSVDIGVYFDDYVYIVKNGLLSNFTMFADKAPWFVTILKLNPFYYVVAGYRDSMLTGNWFWERPKLGIYFWVVTLVIGLVGLRVFKRLRPHFSDVL